VTGGRMRPLRARVDGRSVISFSAGMSAAYVFVKLMPEMHEARRAFAQSMSVSLRYEGKAIYFLALIGFLAFYGLDHLRARLRAAARPEADRQAFVIHVGGFAAYVALMAYLLVHSLDDSAVSILLYTVAFLCHFLAVDHALREEHGDTYQRVGRWVLASMCFLGWMVGVLFALPHYVLAMLVAFVSGAVIMNSAVMELPSDKDGRFVPFMTGGLFYGLLLLPLG
jgi:hypothetical protein